MTTRISSDLYNKNRITANYKMQVKNIKYES